MIPVYARFIKPLRPARALYTAFALMFIGGVFFGGGATVLLLKLWGIL